MKKTISINLEINVQGKCCDKTYCKFLFLDEMWCGLFERCLFTNKMMSINPWNRDLLIDRCADCLKITGEYEEKEFNLNPL